MKITICSDSLKSWSWVLTGFVLVLVPPVFGVEIRLENAADGSGELYLEPGASGQISIIIETSPIDTVNVAFINIFLDDGDDDTLQITSDTNDLPWFYDHGCYDYPCEISEAGGSEYYLVAGDSYGDGLPLGAGAYSVQTITIFNPGERVGDVLITFEPGVREPTLFGPAPKYLLFDLETDCMQPGFPNFTYMGTGNPGPVCAAPFVIHLIEEGDCNGNGIPDEDDILTGTSVDCLGDGLPDECQEDCNGNGVGDSCDVTDGTSGDCDSNGEPDECQGDCDDDGVLDACEIADGTDADCNLNGSLDSCDLAIGSSLDCNLNFIPDDCEPDCNVNAVADDCDIATGASLDCQLNGVPDECEADCNANATPDACDLSSGFSVDCQLNGIPDECDLAADPGDDCNGNQRPDECDVSDGLSMDCNVDSVPDECQLMPLFSFDSGELSPLGAGLSYTVKLESLQPAVGYVTMNFTASGDLDHDEEFVELQFNSAHAADLFVDAAFCAADGDVETLVFLADEFNNWAANGYLTITLIPNSFVNPDSCNGESFIQFTIDYATGQDCNRNGIPDDCDVDSGTSSDSDGDGILDECEPCKGDVNGDGVVDPIDVGFVSARFGCIVGIGDPECDAADANGNGQVNPLDVGFVLARLGGCPR